jgi:predicted type IV restriction endonuclease
MDFKDEIKQIAERVDKLKEQISTEEATKNAFIMPFIKALGYDVFNPLEVVPEYVADIGIKKGEKIDYAIMDNGHPIILVEAKHWNQKLDIHDGQLLRYFHTSKAKFAILTNGIEYWFYSDLEAPNIMDKKPFLSVNMLDLKDNQFEELKKFHKSYFNVDNILTSASELKYTNELKNLINQELNNPSADFVKHFAKQVYSGVITAKVLEQFTGFIKRSSHQYISELITDRFKNAIKKEVDENIQATEVPQTIEADINKIDTTADEIEAFLIVKTILRQHIPSSRIVYRDAQSYFSILLDDNNRKPICRLYLGGNKKFIGLFDDQKKETKNEIYELEDIFNLSKDLLEVVAAYDGSKE